MKLFFGILLSFSGLVKILNFVEVFLSPKWTCKILNFEILIRLFSCIKVVESLRSRIGLFWEMKTWSSKPDRGCHVTVEPGFIGI